MFSAVDNDNNKIFADEGRPYRECFCPACGEALTYKAGSHNIPHFAHKAKSNCSYGRDGDNKSEWHRHMQELFPKECLEVAFTDKETGEKHIADVFIKEAATVIEFQNSPITQEELRKRTLFHISEGRRIVWIFFEIKKDSEDARLVEDPDLYSDWEHGGLEYNWPRAPRKALASVFNGQNLDAVVDRFSVCVYLGDGEDTVHRIYKQYLDYKSVTLSVHDIIIKGNMNVNEFFLPERFWLAQSPWPEMIAEHNRALRQKNSYPVRNIVIKTKPRKRFRM